MQITMKAMFEEYMDGGVCRSWCWRCLQITMMAVFADHEDGGARGPQPDTIQNNDSWPPQHSHLSRAHRAPCPPPAVFLASSSLSPPPISEHTSYPNAVHTMLDPRPFAFLSWGLGLPNTSIGPLPFHKLKLNSTRGSTVSAGLQPPADQRAIAPTPGWSF